METKSKKEYIKAWESYIDGLGPLCWVKNEKISVKVQEHMKDLKSLVFEIAEIKNLK